MKTPLTIYLAEDHTAIRELLVSHLGMLKGYRIVGQTADGAIVVDECRKLRPKLLILDLGMPGRGGVEIARAIAAELPETSVLIFTSHHDISTVRQVMEAGARGMVEKSASFETLLRAINSVGSGKAFFGDAVTQVLHRTFIEPLTTRTADGLTGREREILHFVAEGRSNKEICSRLDISVRTVENHRHNIMKKLNAHNSADLTRAAYRLGLLREEGHA